MEVKGVSDGWKEVNRGRKEMGGNEGRKWQRRVTRGREHNKRARVSEKDWGGGRKTILTLRLNSFPCLKATSPFSENT